MMIGDLYGGCRWFVLAPPAAAGHGPLPTHHGCGLDDRHGEFARGPDNRLQGFDILADASSPY
jgi:hypothetical protein